MRELTSASELDHVLSGDLPVLIGFVAQSCGPCLQQRPIWEDLGRTQAVEVVLVDVDALPELRDRFDVHGLPTTVVLVQGSVRAAVSGVQTTRQLLEGVLA